MLKLLCSAAPLLMLLTRLLRPAPVALSLDDLATVEVPAFFHLDQGPEATLPVARRLLRRPYRDLLTVPDQVTYYLPGQDYHHFGGREIPVLLRVTLYADEASLDATPDADYLRYLQKQNFYQDEHAGYLLKQARPVAPDLLCAEEPGTRPGWWSTKQYTRMHLLLTDPARKVRLFLSAADDKLSRAEAEQLLRRVLQSLRREPAALARYFAYVRPIAQRRDEVEQANVQLNLRYVNQQLAAAELPPLELVERYQPGRFVEAGRLFYGLNEFQEVFFMARLGYSTAARPATPAYFTDNNPDGRYLASFNQQAILQQGGAAGAPELRLRQGVSLPLWFAPEEFARFRVAGLLREAAESEAVVRRQPGFAPMVPTAAVTRWQLSRVEGNDTRAAFDVPTDFRTQALTFAGPASGLSVALHYLGQRTTAGQGPELVFTLEAFDGRPRHRRVAADAQYLAVPATHGGTLTVGAASGRYRVQIEPLSRGHVTVAPLRNP